jgi:hypothetical protein
MYLIKYFSPDGSYPWCCNVTWPAAIHVATRQLLFNYLWSTFSEVRSTYPTARGAR